MFGINALISSNRIKARALKSTDVAANSASGGGGAISQTPLEGSGHFMMEGTCGVNVNNKHVLSLLPKLAVSPSSGGHVTSTEDVGSRQSSSSLRCSHTTVMLVLCHGPKTPHSRASPTCHVGHICGADVLGVRPHFEGHGWGCHPAQTHKHTPEERQQRREAQLFFRCA